MKKAFTILMIFFFALVVVVGILFGVNFYNGEAITYNENLEDLDVEVVSNEPTLSCFDLIDKQLVADGFTYLTDAKWGRGENNFFLIDIVAQEFQIGNRFSTKNLQEDWYSVSFESDVGDVYIHADKQVWNYYSLMNGRDKVNTYEPNSAAAYFFNALGNGEYYHELPIWMDYYIEQTDKYGCSLTGLTTENLLNEYKTKQSTASASNVVSVFDRKSDDGVLRYFADVHVEGAIEDNPRYKELSSYEEYFEIDNISDYETKYFINVLYHDPSKNLLEPDSNNIQSSILKEFTKDVVFTQTTWINDKPGVETFGVYFIYIDNPNGNFRYMYTQPYKGEDNRVYSLFDSFLNIKSPYEGTILHVNKWGVNGPTYPFTLSELSDSLRWYLYYIKDINPGLKYSEDFISNYSRPFNYSWQKRLGLKELFDTKYGFINRDIRYSWMPNDGY